MRWKRPVVWGVAGAVGLIAVAMLILRLPHWESGSVTIVGAVIRRDTNTRMQQPIAGAEVTASDGQKTVRTESDAAGFFRVTFSRELAFGPTVILNFRHADYEPLDLKVQVDSREARRRLYIATMQETALHADVASVQSDSVISNIRIRYTLNSRTEEDIGSAVRTFQIVNKGNVPCNQQRPCSPDGYWKASTNSLRLDAGTGNEFRNVRVSCIAGPCPFTRIDASGFSNGGRTIIASALAWSDTATFLVEAEVFHATSRSNLYVSYPAVFGRGLNFTVPQNQEGVSIEAELDGTPMVFPLGGELHLSWATCTKKAESTDGRGDTAYRCELNPGYRF